jgi:hypothetical protein
VRPFFHFSHWVLKNQPASVGCYRRFFLYRGRSHRLVRKDGFKAPRLALVMQHHDRDDAHRLFARVALCNFALQVL